LKDEVLETDLSRNTPKSNIAKARVMISEDVFLNIMEIVEMV